MQTVRIKLILIFAKEDLKLRFAVRQELRKRATRTLVKNYARLARSDRTYMCQGKDEKDRHPCFFL